MKQCTTPLVEHHAKHLYFERLTNDKMPPKLQVKDVCNLMKSLFTQETPSQLRAQGAHSADSDPSSEPREWSPDGGRVLRLQWEPPTPVAGAPY